MDITINMFNNSLPNLRRRVHVNRRQIKECLLAKTKIQGQT